MLCTTGHTSANTETCIWIRIAFPFGFRNWDGVWVVASSMPFCASSNPPGFKRDACGSEFDRSTPDPRQKRRARRQRLAEGLKYFSCFPLTTATLASRASEQNFLSQRMFIDYLIHIWLQMTMWIIYGCKLCPRFWWYRDSFDSAFTRH